MQKFPKAVAATAEQAARPFHLSSQALHSLHVVGDPVATADGLFARCSCGFTVEWFLGMDNECPVGEVVDYHRGRVVDLMEQFDRDIARLRVRDAENLARFRSALEGRH